MTQVIGILFAVSGVLFVLWRPRWAVMLILIMFPLEQLLSTYVPFLVENSWFFNFFCAGLAGLAVIQRIVRGETPTLGMFNTTFFCLWGLYGLAWVTLAWTPGPEQAQAALTRGLPYMLLIVVLLPMLLDDLHDFERLAIGLLIFGTVLAVMILLNPSANIRGGRLTLDTDTTSDGRQNPLALASFGGMIALIAALVRFEGRGLFLQVLRPVSLISGLGLAIGSGSRGQVLAAVIAGIAFYPMSRQMANARQFLLTSFGFLLLGGLFFVTFTLFIGDENLRRWDLTGMQTATSGRFEMIQVLLSAYVSNPMAWITGLGASAFSTLWGTGTAYPHNVFVEILCELGLVGAGLLTALTVSTVRSGLFLWRRYRDDATMRSLAAVLCALVGFSFILMSKQGSFMNAGASSFLWWIVLSTIANLEQRAVVVETDGAGTEDYTDEQATWVDTEYGDSEEEYAVAY